MFSTDNLVVYPAQGIGIIEHIDQKNIGGLICEFYIVKIRSNNITLMVPVKNAANVGLRPLISGKRAAEILKFLQEDLDKTIFTGQNWNRRFKEYSGRLKSPDLYVVAEMLRELLLIGRIKELSFGEKRLQEQAMQLVCEELAEVLNISAAKLKNEITELYAPLIADEVCENA